MDRVEKMITDTWTQQCDVCGVQSSKYLMDLVVFFCIFVYLYA